jgi:hypothetical protein
MAAIKILLYFSTLFCDISVEVLFNVFQKKRWFTTLTLDLTFFFYFTIYFISMVPLLLGNFLNYFSYNVKKKKRNVWTIFERFLIQPGIVWLKYKFLYPKISINYQHECVIKLKQKILMLFFFRKQRKINASTSNLNRF